MSQDSGSLTPHLPGPRKTPPAFGNWRFPPRTADPQSRVLPWPDLKEVACPSAHGEPGLAAPSRCLVPEWLLSEPEMDSSQPGQRGPDSFLPVAEPMHRASGGGPSPRGLAVYSEEASRPQVRPLGQPPHCPLGPLARLPAQLPGLQGRAESGHRVNGLSVSCPLNSRGFRCHRGGACPLGGHSQLQGARAMHPGLGKSSFSLSVTGCPSPRGPRLGLSCPRGRCSHAPSRSPAPLVGVGPALPAAGRPERWLPARLGLCSPRSLEPGLPARHPAAPVPSAPSCSSVWVLLTGWALLRKPGGR